MVAVIPEDQESSHSEKLLTKKQKVEEGANGKTSVHTFSDEPPTKKKKLEDGAAVATARAKKTGPSVRKTKRRFSDIPIHETNAFTNGRFRFLLNAYLQGRDGKQPKPVFKFSKREEVVNDTKCELYVATCEVGKEIGRGLAANKKKSMGMACLDILQKFGLIPKEKITDVMAVPKTLPSPKKQKPKKPKPVIPMLERKVYLEGQFQCALYQYLQKSNPDVKLIFDHKLVRCETRTLHITTCKTERLGFEGCARSTNKKRSLLLACVDYMLKMGILTKEQHFKKHPGLAKEDQIGGGVSETAKIEGKVKNGLVDAWAK